MQISTSTTRPRRRLAFVPVEERRSGARPVIRRYKLSRVFEDMGVTVVAHRGLQAPAQGVRAP